MSDSRLVRNSPDLQRLLDEGYSLRVQAGYLLVADIPYVDAAKTIQRGTFLCPLDVAGERTTKPENHVMAFIGSAPCNRDGAEINAGFAQPGLTYNWSAGPNLTPSVGFSQKPRPEGYVDYYEKVTTYAAILIGPAQALDPSVTPQMGKPLITDEDDGVFVYMDTFSSRAGITERNQLLELDKVVIVGLGGTGSYILDALAKTPIRHLHLYDRDTFATHNAFRAPGAATVEDLTAAPTKVDYHAQRYSAMRRQIHPHSVHVTEENLAELLDANFVFLAMDAGPAKTTIIQALIGAEVPFIDIGIGVDNDPDGIAGQIRITTSTPGRSDHITRHTLISAVDGDGAEYDTNLQVVELNMIAAGMAVVQFKKIFGFYADHQGDRHSTLVIADNQIHSRYGTPRETGTGTATGTGAEASA